MLGQIYPLWGVSAFDSENHDCIYLRFVILSKKKWIHRKFPLFLGA